MTVTIGGDPEAPICASGKRGYRTEALAERSLDSARRHRSEGGTGRRPDATETAVYECPACHWWHLSSTRRASRRGQLGNAKSARRRRR